MTETITDKLVVVSGASSRLGAFAMSQPEDADTTEILFRPTRREL
ncbi:MAG TPA: hypothetical protein VMM15_34400 [Bradyrhizobium sp.]|nr:hypothetical protein [Bradyrhizobium sp.]